ncbi:F-box/LRR-repeat protein 25-like [Bidens hawaiensis]|uniref:F-box/LRR-repeat protein 25-like n=1 Tax=Bidens hawaiensis TaxID=980011 RepID=UPI004048FDE3
MHANVKMVKDDDKDRISKLPDCLLSQILGRLPNTRYAIRTGTLSKRWKHIWTSVPNLVFIHPHPISLKVNPSFFSSVDKTLTQRQQLRLKKFKLHSNYSPRFESQVNSWLHYAIHCNVEDLFLKLYGLDRINKFSLDQVFLSSSCFTDLSLAGCMFDPTRAVSWQNLTSLCISYVSLDEDLIENILAGSPALETLEMKNCYCYRYLNITSKSVRNLVLSGQIPPLQNCSEIIEINAPNILSLTIKGRYALWKFVLLNVSSLVEADLDYVKCPCFRNTDKEDEEEMLKGFILKLRNVKDLKVGTSCFEVLARLEAKGFVFPSNLKVLDFTP